MLQLSFILNQKKYTVSNQGRDISIPLHFNGVQPNSYGVPAAKSQAFEGGGFVGDVRRGGSCNFEVYEFIPHCNGTHTECVGHISAERVAIHERLQESFIPATLITISPQNKANISDTYQPDFSENDLIIDRTSLEKALRHVHPDFLDALIIRTSPNNDSKKSRDYTQHDAPFFSIEAMQLIREKGVQHLLIDTPSVDRMLDEGKLSAHHVFFDIPFGQNEEINPVNYTITEFIYVENEIKDGAYLLNLQIAAFMSDASPSRPRLYAVSELLNE